MSQPAVHAPRRSLLAWRRGALPGLARTRSALPLVGALLGLAVALPGGLLQAVQPPVTTVPGGVVALVNQRPILLNDYVTQTERDAGVPFAKASATARAQVLHAMVDEELMVQRSLALDLPENDTDIRRALVQGLEEQVGAPVQAQPVSDAALRAYYGAHTAAFATAGTMRVRNLVLHAGGVSDANQTVAQATQDAAEAAYQLRAGAPVAGVMEHYGFVDAPQADAGAQFDFAARLHLGDALYAVAKPMEAGDVSDPVVQPDGVHLLVMADRQPPHASGFESARAAVYAAYRKMQTDQAQATTLAQLRREAVIRLAPGVAE